jgi:hypothetical protein
VALDNVAGVVMMSGSTTRMLYCWVPVPAFASTA